MEKRYVPYNSVYWVIKILLSPLKIWEHHTCWVWTKMWTTQLHVCTKALFADFCSGFNNKNWVNSLIIEENTRAWCESWYFLKSCHFFRRYKPIGLCQFIQAESLSLHIWRSYKCHLLQASFQINLKHHSYGAWEYLMFWPKTILHHLPQETVRNCRVPTNS